MQHDPHPKVRDICGHTRILIVRYRAAKDCQVQANYPVNPGAGATWTIKAGKEIGWRFNVDAHVAEVFDPARATAHTFPHWGFVTDRTCIGKSISNRSAYWRFQKTKTKPHGAWVRHVTTYPAGQRVPTRIHYGRSQNKKTHYWNHVEWDKTYGAIPATDTVVKHNRTLRDRPNEFVIGNVRAGWHVRTTHETKAGYTKVYVPVLHKWGWLQL